MITKKNIIDFMGMFTDTAVIKVIDNDGSIMDIKDISYCQDGDKFAIALRIDKSYAAEPKPPQTALQTSNKYSINIWTDGSCSGNPGTGGWAYYIKYYSPNGKITAAVGYSERVATSTTNNRMELIAAIKALDKCFSIKEITTLIGRDTPITLTTDSEYMVNIMTGVNKAKANHDLIGYLNAVCKDMNITWQWQKRNSCDELKRCDAMANAAATTSGYTHKGYHINGEIL